MADYYNKSNPRPQTLKKVRVTAYGYGEDNAYEEGKKP